VTILGGLVQEAGKPETLQNTFEPLFPDHRSEH
jgi:hypothetical protein